MTKTFDSIIHAGSCGLPSGDLYTLPNGTITLSTCNATGLAGPTAAMCQLQYNATGYSDVLNYYAVVNNGTQVLTVPRTSSYKLTVAGSLKSVAIAPSARSFFQDEL